MKFGAKYILGGALLCGALGTTSGTAHAASFRWVGSDGGSWNSAANWSPVGIPGTADSVSIDAKRIVAVPADVTVAALTVGAGAEVRTSGRIKVTGKTLAQGLFTGLGALDIPVGGNATYKVTPDSPLAILTGNVPPVVLAPITNKGNLVTSVAQGCRVDFASIQNDGTTQISSDGTITFKDIKNTQNLSIAASGTLKLAKLDNASGATLSVAVSSNLVNSVANLLGTVVSTVTNPLRDSNSDNDNPAMIQMDDLDNHVNGIVKFSGGVMGRYFDGKSIYNEGTLQMSGTQTMLDGDITNTAGATLILDSNAKIFPADGTLPQLNNAGTIRKVAGSDATLNVDWNNSGRVVVENGTLHICVPQGKGGKQTGGNTTLEGGTLSIEDPSGFSSVGTYELAGGTLDGIGTIRGNILNSGGHVAPGHSPGTVTINGNYTQTANGVLDMEVGGTDAGSSYDQVLVNGTANLDGTLNFVRWQNYVPRNGDVYTLLTFYSKMGKFAQFVDSSPVSGVTYDTTLTPTDYEVNCYANPSDGTPPVVSITSPTDGRAATSIASASGKASDATGVKSVTCRLYRYANPATGAAAGFWAGGTTWTSSGTPANELPTKGTTSWTFAFPTLVAGRYSLRATGTDTAGNSAYSNTTTFYVDPNAPSVLSVDSPASGASVSSLSSISGTVSDASDGSGILSVTCQLKRNTDGYYWTGSAWSSNANALACTLSGTKWTSNPNMPTGTNLRTGNYTINATATDKAGNTKTVNSSFTVSSTSSTASGSRG